MSRLSDTIPVWLRAPRNTLWLLAAVLLLALIAVVSPVQLPVVLYKLALVALAVVVGYWVDRALFPYARPDGYLERDWRFGTEEPEGDVDFRIVPAYGRVFNAAMLRRAIIVGAVLHAMASGL
ncbi:MAG TPA: putative holin [Pseudomonas sp.]|nr:putative holin [Pseudomonas sp.]